ncbi:hypothetical protein MMPV_005861 [Pyropia vietnamensis]
MLPLSTADRMNILLDVASALGYLHSVDDRVHLNVHPGTVWIPISSTGGRGGSSTPAGGSGSVKLSDPAVHAPEVGPKLFYAQTLIAPAAFRALRYLPPEVARKESPTPAADVWQLGLLAYVLFAERQPYAAPDDGDISSDDAALLPRLVDRLQAARPPPRVHLAGSSAPPSVVELIYGSCLVADPRRRAPMWEILHRLYALRRQRPALFGTVNDLRPMLFERALAAPPGDPAAVDGLYGHPMRNGGASSGGGGGGGESGVGGLERRLQALFRLRFRGAPFASVANLLSPIGEWERRAGRGDVEAAWNLHACYRRGQYIARNLYTSLAWLTKARELELAQLPPSPRTGGGEDVGVAAVGPPPPGPSPAPVPAPPSSPAGPAAGVLMDGEGESSRGTTRLRAALAAESARMATAAAAADTDTTATTGDGDGTLVTRASGPPLSPPLPQAGYARQSSMFGGSVLPEPLDMVPARAGTGIRRLPVDDDRGLLVRWLLSEVSAALAAEQNARGGVGGKRGAGVDVPAAEKSFPEGGEGEQRAYQR